MKIMKTQKDALKDKIAQLLITPERCPYCGETRDYWDFTDDPKLLYRGIARVTSDTRYKMGRFFCNGKFYTKGFYVKVDQYKCHTCGAEWVTDPYRADGYNEMQK